jgi:hypothetical protein
MRSAPRRNSTSMAPASSSFLRSRTGLSGERLLGAILDERQFAVLEPSARTSQLAGVGGPRGTFFAEMLQSGPLMYKAFPVQMILTHGMRAAQQADFGSRAAYGMAVLATTTMAGALTLQVKSIVSGRDPRDMSRPSFWANALVTGGALGIYGDLLSTGTTKSGGQALEALLGPIASVVTRATCASGIIRSQIEDNPRNFGGWLAQLARYNTPGTNLWYTRLGTDRLLWDQIQMMIDPEYRRSFHRTEQRARENYGQEFWFRPGETSPERAPELGSVLGR